MNSNFKINWLNVVSFREFQSNLDLNLLKEISMVSKLTREKLKPILFKNLKLSLESIKFEFNIILKEDNNRFSYSNYLFNEFLRENKGNIPGALDDFIIALNNIKKFTKNLYYECNRSTGYCFNPLIKVFDNLTDLKVYSSDLPSEIFTDMGNILPNLKSVTLVNVCFINPTTDNISAKYINFPPNLSYMKLFSVCVISSTLLSNPTELFLITESNDYSYENLTLSKISIPSLKRLDYKSWGEESLGIEEFLEANPNVESLLTRDYNLNVSNSLNSLKSLDIDECISFNSIGKTYRLKSINSLRISIDYGNYYEIIRKLCQLCPNIVNLSIHSDEMNIDFQSIIDNCLVPILSNLNSLKSLALIDAYILANGQIIDFTKLAHIEKLKIKLDWRSVSNIKFDSCKSLKQVELKSFRNKFTDEFMRKFNYQNWKFEFSENTIKGYKLH